MFVIERVVTNGAEFANIIHEVVFDVVFDEENGNTCRCFCCGKMFNDKDSRVTFMHDKELKFYKIDKNRSCCKKHNYKLTKEQIEEICIKHEYPHTIVK